MSSPKITKADLIERISEVSKLPKKEIALVLETLGHVIEVALIAGQEVVIPHLGILSTRITKERKGANPSTQEAITIPARRNVRLSVTKPLREMVKEI